MSEKRDSFATQPGGNVGRIGASEEDESGSIATREVIGSDDMFTVLRSERPPHDPDAAPVVTFREKLVLRLIMLEEYFTAQNWPTFRGRVRVGDADGNGWEPIPADWEAALTDGVSNGIETGPPIGVQKGPLLAVRRRA